MHEHLELRHWHGLVASGDHAILEAYTHLATRGIKRILIQDQGGWLTYKDYAKKQQLEVIVLPTTDGILNPHDIPLAENCALIINSLTAYIAPQPMRAISERCKTLGITLINDASGSIGTPDAHYGDIILASFGKDKPVNAHYGGFIAANTPLFIQNSFETETPAILGTATDTLAKRHLITHHLDALNERLAFLHSLHWQIKKDLCSHDIVHRNAQGINVIVKFHTDAEKQTILRYCEEHAYPTTLCPRDIRITSPAISIEVKRLTT